MTNTIHDPGYRQRLIRKLSRGGTFKVVFGSYPEHPEVREYIAMQPGSIEPYIRYVNIDAEPGANISRILTT